jgi:hypothetical protein
MGFSKSLSCSFFAALILTDIGSSGGFAEQPASQIVAGKEKILAQSTATAERSNATMRTARGDSKDPNNDAKNDAHNASNNPGKCQSKTNRKCPPVSPSN